MTQPLTAVEILRHFRTAPLAAARVLSELVADTVAGRARKPKSTRKSTRTRTTRIPRIRPPAPDDAPPA